MTPEFATLLMMIGLLVGIFIGFPLAFVLLGVGLWVGLAAWGGAVIEMMVLRMYWIMASEVLVAVPLFIFMGCVLERGAIADAFFKTVGEALSSVRGSLALTTVIICTVMAASTGIIGASITTIGLLALPSMVKYGYNKPLSTGCICAGGTLGVLIPPSVVLILYGPTAGVSVVHLFVAAIMPGLLLSALYLTYIIVRCNLQPHLAPPVPVQEKVHWARMFLWILKDVFPFTVLILSVLGSIMFGLAAPTEAAAVGAFGSLALLAAYRRLTWQTFKESVYQTLKISTIIMFVAAGASAFTGTFLALGGGKIIEEFLLGLGLGPYGTLAVIMAAIFVAGKFIEWIGIILVFVPVITPIAAELGFDALWFAMLVNVCLQTSYLTPPFAYSIFYLKGVAPPEVQLTDIYKGVYPFVALQITGLILCILFPSIILWLPRVLYG